MTKFIETLDDDDIEVAGYETLIELSKLQHETTREGIETLSNLAIAFFTIVQENNKAERANELRRIKLEEARLKFQKEQYQNDLTNQRLARECVPTENFKGLPKEALAAESSASTKRKTKPRSTKG